MYRSKLKWAKSKTYVGIPDRAESPGEDNIKSIVPPTPLDFQNFIPWICLQWCTERPVTVDRIDDGKNKVPYSILELPCDPEIKPVKVCATYTDACLVSISIIDADIKIPGKVIRAVSLCLPYHKKLSHLTVRRAATTCAVVHEISQLLPHSNITNICLDDSNLPVGNYDLLLKHASQLTYLSLNRCNINDTACKNIAMCLVYGRPAAKSVRALELASNDITDDGLQYLGTMLRRNRILLHLNLAGNKITYDAGRSLLVPLKEFPLTSDETLMIKRERLAQYKKELQREPTVSSEAVEDKQKKKTVDHLATPNDPFSANNLILKNGSYYCKGNFTLCSLNLAYNNLDYFFLRILSDVAAYQKASVESPATGLIRVVITGNNLPKFYDELTHLEHLLKWNYNSSIMRHSKSCSFSKVSIKSSRSGLKE